MVAKKNELTEILGMLGNNYATIAEDGSSADIEYFVDTGSYALNALYSGSIFGGIPSNKISAIAGEESVGKSFYLLAICKSFLDKDPQALVIIFESEGSLTSDLVKERGLDPSRVAIVPVETVQQFHTQCLKVVQNQLSKPEKQRRPMLFGLDSLGMLSTSKEMADSESGKEVKDMTRTQMIRSAFRTLTLKLSKAKIPLIVTNHTYQTMGLFSTKEMSGGGGTKYAANNITFLSKSKDKDSSGNMTGAKIKCKVDKSRITREGTQVTTLLSFSKGLDRFYGLVEIGLDSGVLEENGRKIIFPDKSEGLRTKIEREPEKYFTEDILKALDVGAAKLFKYGMTNNESLLDDEVLEEDE